MADIYARDAALRRLDGFLQEALAGNGQVCLVSGEAGSGKTALLEAFGLRAAAAHEELVVVVGTCDAQTGEGDAYLPFREIMQQLTGDFDARLERGKVSQLQANRLKKMMLLAGETLIDLAPDLIGVVVPGATLAAKAGKMLAGKTKWNEKLHSRLDEGSKGPAAPLDKSQVYEQYVNVLQRLAQEAPLLLVVDDLQWADTASLGLMFRLARRLEGQRLLLVGLYRPNDLAVERDGQRHPLESLLSELKRYQGDVTIDLDAAIREDGRAFIDALLDRERNDLGEGFRAALHGHTGGHPLFTIELLRNLQERGDLRSDDDGGWTASRALSWDDLPSRVEGVIEERINRLEGDMVRSLQIASVEGPQFTAEAVAKVQPFEARELIRRLSETLQRQHRLVSSAGLGRVGAQRVSHYRFANQLLQSYLYQLLDEAEASYLHEDMGLALEGLYGDQADQVAVQLARHFDIAGVPDKARHYLVKAAEQAAARYANEQALGHYRAALGYTPPDDFEARYALLLAMVGLNDLKGDKDALLEDITALSSAAEQLGEPLKRAEAAIQRASYHLAAAEYPAAIEHAGRASALAAPLDEDGGAEGRARIIWGRALMGQANYDAAKSQLQQGLVLARLAGNAGAEGQALSVLGILSEVTGQLADGRRYFQKSLDVHVKTGNRKAQANAYANLGVSRWRAGEYEAARELLEQALAIAREIGDRSGEGVKLGNLAIITLDLGDLPAAKRHAEQAIRINREVSGPYAVARTLGVYANILLKEGDLPGARGAHLEALEIDLDTGDRQDQVHRLVALGNIALELGDAEEALARLEAGLELGLAIEELNAACSLHSLLSKAHQLFGDRAAALEHADRAVALAERLGTAHVRVMQLVRRADAHLALGDANAAQADLDRADELAGEARVLDLSAAVAEVALARGDLGAAAAAIEPLVEPALTGRLDAADDPFRVHLSVHRVLRAVSDARAQPVLGAAREALSRVAGRLDEGARAAFEQHPVHRELLKAQLEA